MGTTTTSRWFAALGCGKESNAGGRTAAWSTRGSSYVSKVWFITGASKGFGREWALAALERGARWPRRLVTSRH